MDGQGNPLTNKTHSPILGWAYDGNPIYGSFGYDNPYQDTSVLLQPSKGWNRLGD